MSHFSVAVITKPEGKSVDELLAPYHEFECTGIEQYIKDVDETKAKLKDYNTDKITMYFNKNTKKLSYTHCDEFYREPTKEEIEEIGIMAGSGCNSKLSWSSKNWGDGKGYRAKIHFIPEGYKEKVVPLKKLYTFVDYLQNYCEIPAVKFGEPIDLSDKHKYNYFTLNKKGGVSKVIRRTNPKSKWDWYKVGGRWSGSLRLKKRGCVDSAKVKDIDFSLDNKKYNNCLRFWGVFIEKQPLKEDENQEDFTSFYNEKFYLDKYKTKENYATTEASFKTYAVITPDGRWHAEGKMGWWGFSSATNKDSLSFVNQYKKKFIDTAEPEWTITIVDCHI
jgi:hypothetical protein